MFNPLVYSGSSLEALTEHQLLVALYQLHLSFTLLLMSSSVVFLVVFFLNWLLPKFWYRRRVKL